MQTNPGLDARSEGLVAVEAELGGDSLAGTVAGKALTRAFESGVRRRERTGRELRGDAGREAEEGERGDGEDDPDHPPPQA